MAELLSGSQSTLPEPGEWGAGSGLQRQQRPEGRCDSLITDEEVWDKVGRPEKY